MRNEAYLTVLAPTARVGLGFQTSVLVIPEMPARTRGGVSS
jgi:hypothetical protein